MRRFRLIHGLLILFIVNVILMLSIFFTGCGEEYNLTDTVFIEDLHYHAIDVGHAHPIENFDHSHTGDELIEALLQQRVAEVYEQALEEGRQRALAELETQKIPENPFSVIILATQEAMELQGSDEIINLAISELPPEKKMQKLLLLPDSEAKKLLIQAYAEHSGWITQIANQFGAIR